MTRMSDSPPNRRRVWPAVVAALVLLPALYVASMGPVVGLADRGYIPESVLSVLSLIYYPATFVISWVCSYSDTAEAVVLWYFDLFVT